MPGENAFTAGIHGPIQGIKGVFIQPTGNGFLLMEGLGLRPQGLVHDDRSHW